jgi:hypothetical protein
VKQGWKLYISDARGFAISGGVVDGKPAQAKRATAVVEFEGAV